MGFDIDLFQTEIDPELHCSICSGVFDQPLRLKECDHCFCKRCLSKWMSQKKDAAVCPTCRAKIEGTVNTATRVDRMVCNILNRQTMCCERRDVGCLWTGTLEVYTTAHVLVCEHHERARDVRIVGHVALEEASYGHDSFVPGEMVIVPRSDGRKKYAVIHQLVYSKPNANGEVRPVGASVVVEGTFDRPIAIKDGFLLAAVGKIRV